MISLGRVYQASCLSVPLPSLLQWSRHYHTLNASHHTLHFLWHAIHLSNGPVGCGRPVITYARCFCVSVCICTVMYLSLDLCHLKFCADESVFVLAVSSSLNHPPVNTHFCTLFIVCLCHLLMLHALEVCRLCIWGCQCLWTLTASPIKLLWTVTESPWKLSSCPQLQGSDGWMVEGWE